MVFVAETTPSLPPLPSTREKGRRMLSKRLYVLVAAVAAIAVVLVAFFIPQGAAIIPLEVNYTVGETMVYNIIQEVAYLPSSTPAPDPGPGPSSPPNSTHIQTATVVVTDFDGQYYILNRTTKITHDGYTSDAPLITQKINKHGYTITIFRGNETSASGNQNPFITEILNRSEVRVGDTWTVPIARVDSIGSYFGSMTLTFQGIEDITVPAGTFQVFRVDSVSNATLQMNLTVHPTADFNTSTIMTISQNGTMYMEYNTCRPIKSSVTQIQSMQTLTTTGNLTLTSSNYTILLIGNTDLVQDILQ